VPAPIPVLNRTQIERALERRLIEQEALVELSQIALDGRDPDAVMKVAVKRLAEIQEVDIVSLMERFEGQMGLVRAVVGATGDQVGVTTYHLHAQTPGGLALARGAPVLVENLITDPRFPSSTPLRERGAVSGINVVVPSGQGTWGVLGVWTGETRRFSGDDVHFVQAIANLVGGVLTRAEVEARLAEAVTEKDRRLRYERALSNCAQALLGDFGPTSIEVSLSALMESTNASFGSVDWNGVENSSVPTVVLGKEGTNSELQRHWDQVSWDDLPTIRDELAAGRTVIVAVEDLPGNEPAPFLNGPEPVRSEIDTPIVINGIWAGTLGIGDHTAGRTWDRIEIQALEMAASLLASWWQRRDYAERLEVALSSRNRSLLLEKAIAAVSHALGRANTPEDLEGALRMLLEGTDATSVFIERNIVDPSKGLCSQVVSVAQRPGAGYDPRYWDMMPWDRMPTTRAALAAGKEIVLAVEDLEGPEAETYASSPVLSEIDVPILIEGRWEGLIGLSDEKRSRRWDTEVEMLRTAADLIAAYWARIDSSRRLEELMKSKDEFIASISHELRTPLTAVLGLAESLIDPTNVYHIVDPNGFIRVIAEQSSEMSAIVQDLLVVARIDSGRVTIRHEDLDLGAEVETSIRGIRPERQIDLEVSGSARAVGDPFRVRQIIRNLLSNAGRYGGTRIRIEVESSESVSTIRVMDDGRDIPREDRDRIFQPYERAHDRRGQPASVGLGLTVSRQLAELMGGTLCYDYIDGWSCFTLELQGT
jgi:signal transduction histidine kinase